MGWTKQGNGGVLQTFQLESQFKTRKRKVFEMPIWFMDSKTIDILFKSCKEDVNHALEYNYDGHGGQRSLGQMQVGIF